MEMVIRVYTSKSEEENFVDLHTPATLTKFSSAKSREPLQETASPAIIPSMRSKEDAEKQREHASPHNPDQISTFKVAEILPFPAA